MFGLRRISGMFSLQLSCVLVAVIFLGACSDEDSELQHLVSTDVSLAAVESVIQASKRVMVINLHSSRSTYFKNAQVVASWPSVTADVTGKWHKRDGVPVPQFTPPGIYSVHTIEHCPIWRPRSPKDPETKEHVDDEPNRQRIFRENPDIYGPCGVKNPLGEYVVWFYQAYGYHGSAGEHHWRFVDKLPFKRASGGCIRNPYDKISAFVDDILLEPELIDFGKLIEANKAAFEPQTVTQYGADQLVDVKIVVGTFEDLSYESSELSDGDPDRYKHLYEHLLKQTQ